MPSEKRTLSGEKTQNKKSQNLQTIMPGLAYERHLANSIAGWVMENFFRMIFKNKSKIFSRFELFSQNCTPKPNLTKIICFNEKLLDSSEITRQFLYYFPKWFSTPINYWMERKYYFLIDNLLSTGKSTMQSRRE